MRDRVVVITGAFGALGRAVAADAARRGARVAALDYAPSPPAGLDEALGADGLILGGLDLSNPAAAAQAVEAVLARHGRLDVLINIAGGFVWQTTAEGDPAQWERMFALNVRTALNMCRAAQAPLLNGGAGRIVNIGANAAIRADAGMGAYAAAKSGVHRLTESLAQELKGKVTVNAVLPSIIDTPANRADMPDADFAKWVTPAQLAAVILFLGSIEAGAVTGALIPVTGGV